ncbi:MAG TPA: GntR family transcriptional regulator [Acidimicrobiales bacterium]|nr:GntR family transcriptional regulator [Acidimicrobiales bacterium]
MRVDRRSPVPLWAQILADLRDRLAAGEFADGFPSDVELVAHYRVSRQTVRESVRHLQQEGVVERVRGQGTSVRTRPIEQTLGAMYSLFRSAEAQGVVQESVVRHLEERENAEAAAMLGLEPGEPLVYLERLRLLDGKPGVLDCSWLPARLARPILDADFHHTALYRELEVRCGLRPDSGWERLLPVLPSPEQRGLLGLGPRTSAFAIERLAYAGPIAVEWRHGIIRADRFQFVARWSPGRLDAAFEAPGAERPDGDHSAAGRRAE